MYVPTPNRLLSKSLSLGSTPLPPKTQNPKPTTLPALLTELPARDRMGTREVYEQKLRTGNLDHDPTINPGLGTPRCPRCLSPLDSEYGGGEWTITPVLHDATAVAGSGLGAMLSSIYGFNSGIQSAHKYVKGPKWLQFLVGIPSLVLFTAGGAAFGGYALPRFTQLTVTSYYAASSASHYGISLLTRHIEEAHISKTQQDSKL